MNKNDLIQNDKIVSLSKQIASYYRELMFDEGYNTFGELYNFHEVIEMNGSVLEVFFILPDYFTYAENGRKPGKMPPVNEILKWLKFKHLVPKTRAEKIPSTTQLAYAISKSIAKNGTKGKHLLQKTIDATYDTIVDEMVNAIGYILETEIDNEVNNLYE